MRNRKLIMQIANVLNHFLWEQCNNMAPTMHSRHWIIQTQVRSKNSNMTIVSNDLLHKYTSTFFALYLQSESSRTISTSITVDTSLPPSSPQEPTVHTYYLTILRSPGRPPHWSAGNCLLPKTSESKLSPSHSLLPYIVVIYVVPRNVSLLLYRYKTPRMRITLRAQRRNRTGNETPLYINLWMHKYSRSSWTVKSSPKYASALVYQPWT